MWSRRCASGGPGLGLSSYVICSACGSMRGPFPRQGPSYRLQVSPDVRLDLPQVAVVGSQSSGKSSVLEALVGVAGLF